MGDDFRDVERLVWITRAGLPRCSILERPMPSAVFPQCHAMMAAASSRLRMRCHGMSARLVLGGCSKRNRGCRLLLPHIDR